MTIGYFDPDPGDCQETPRALRSVELLRATGIILVQRDGPNQAHNGWRYACAISGLEVRGPGFWLRCAKLTKLD
jgi:hypothetical protein